MSNTVYSNFYLANEIEDLYASKLALQNFVTVRNDLVGRPGMTYVVNKYSATSGAEVVTKGNGNTKDIAVSYTPATYNIACVQARAPFYDEEALEDPFAIQVLNEKLAADMFDAVNADIYTEQLTATTTIAVSTPDFNAFVDAQASMNLENLENTYMYAVVAPADVAKIRKAAGASLQYVEQFVRQGYVGTLAGVQILTKKDATPGKIVVATPQAVTLFNKSGVEVEAVVNGNRSIADANTRSNTIYARKYYVAALTDDSKIALITF